MTDPDLPLSPEGEADAAAAEYALGVLGAAERAAAEARMRRDPAFAARVAAWERRLAPLAEGLAPVPPPDLMPAIEARLFGRPAPRRRRAFWAGLAAGLATAAAAVTALLLLAPPPAPAPAPAPAPRLAATLAAEDGGLVFAATWDGATGTLTVARTGGPAAAAGRDYQLWVLREGAPPAPLGLVRDGPLALPLPDLAAGVLLAVSLEPEGGSPTGLPTGPVLAAGPVTGG